MREGLTIVFNKKREKNTGGRVGAHRIEVGKNKTSAFQLPADGDKTRFICFYVVLFDLNPWV
jgi:hypothetical protein